jgi:hypothetical protein
MMPEMTPVVAESSRLPIKKFQEPWDFVEVHRDTAVGEASDVLLVARQGGGWKVPIRIESGVSTETCSWHSRAISRFV